MLVAAVVAVLTICAWRPGRARAFLAVGLALGSVGDVFSLYWSATGHSGSALFDTLWPLSVVLLRFAAWQPTRPVGVLVLQGRRLLAFPLAFVLVALGLLSMPSVSPLHAGGYLLALATVVGAAVRMALTSPRTCDSCSAAATKR